MPRPILRHCGMLATATAFITGGALAPRDATAADCAPPAAGASSYIADGCRGTVTGGTFDTGASDFAAVLQASNAGVLTVTGPVTLRSGGDDSTGAYAHDGASIAFNAPGSTLTMRGAHSNGVHAFGTATVTGQVDITTGGERAHAAFMDFGGVIELHQSSILTTGPQAGGGVVASGGAFRLLGPSSITTTGDLAPGLAETDGNSTIVVDAQGGRTTIRTTGRESPGATADTQGYVLLRGVDVRTEGEASIGLLSTSTGTAVAADGNPTVNTLGDRAIAAQAIGGGTVALSGGSVTTAGTSAFGLSSRDAGSQVIVDGTSVTTTGPGAHAVYVHNGGVAILRNGSASATGSGGSALYLTGDTATTIQSVDIANSALASAAAPAISVMGGTTRITLTGGSVFANGLWLDVADGAAPVQLDLVATGTTFDRPGAGRLQPYATVNWWHDQVKTSVSFNDVPLGQLFLRDRYELKLGVNADLARGWTSWGNIGGQWGGQGYRQYSLRLGARYSW